ncbi:hypothetical protein WME94_27500 [Sorangium sp. So ce429]
MADGAAEPHIRCNVLFNHHVRVAEYLAQPSATVGSARGARAREGT